MVRLMVVMRKLIPNLWQLAFLEKSRFLTFSL